MDKQFHSQRMYENIEAPEEHTDTCACMEEAVYLVRDVFGIEKAVCVDCYMVLEERQEIEYSEVL